jgi:hypothetical protein
MEFVKLKHGCLPTYIHRVKAKMIATILKNFLRGLDKEEREMEEEELLSQDEMAAIDTLWDLIQEQREAAEALLAVVPEEEPTTPGYATEDEMMNALLNYIPQTEEQKYASLALYDLLPLQDTRG